MLFIQIITLEFSLINNHLFILMYIFKKESQKKVEGGRENR